MNRGTALKWADMMLSGDYKYLGSPYFREHSDNSFSPVGVLLDLLDPNGWEVLPLGGEPYDNKIPISMYSWNGAVSFLELGMLRKGKIKNGDFIVQVGQLPSNVSILDDVSEYTKWRNKDPNARPVITCFEDAASWVTTNYKEI